MADYSIAIHQRWREQSVETLDVSAIIMITRIPVVHRNRHIEREVGRSLNIFFKHSCVDGSFKEIGLKPIVENFVEVGLMCRLSVTI
jgi:hypothetical protein